MSLRLNDRVNRLEKLVEKALGAGCDLCAGWPVLAVVGPSREPSCAIPSGPCEGCGSVPSVVLVNTGIAAGPPGSQFRPAGPPAPGGILVHSALEPRSVLEPQQGEGALS